MALNVIKPGGIKLKSDEEHSVMASTPFISFLNMYKEPHIKQIYLNVIIIIITLDPRLAYPWQ